jgi:ketosteroid isomerase-like protein
MQLIEMARRYYQSYETGDRSFVEGVLADDFAFTSPFDDGIGRDAYFARCWPNHASHRKFHFEAMMEDRDTVLVVYRLDMHFPNTVHPGASFRNAERMTFEKGKLKSVDVFMGDPPGGLTRQQFAEQSGAA